MKKNNNIIWNGVYESFSDIQSEKEVFNDNLWLLSQEKEVSKILNIIETEKKIAISSVTEGSHDALSVILGIKAFENKVTVLDFGGGIGSTFLKSLEMVENINNVKFIILESEIICQKAQEIFSKNNQVIFVNKIPSNSFKCDIVNASSSMQYIDDWKGLLKSFQNYKPEFMIFSDLPAGDIESFVTTQSYYGNKIPVRFYNIGEFIFAMEEIGYKLTSKARQDNGYKSHMNVFEKKYRLDYFSTLVFRAL
jgi:putative methyltransferase (TIGR04325 family)